MVQRTSKSKKKNYALALALLGLIALIYAITVMRMGGAAS